MLMRLIGDCNEAIKYKWCSVKCIKSDV